MSIGPPIPEIQHFQNLTLKFQGRQGQTTMMLRNYRSGQFHRNSNGINPSRVQIYGFHKVWPKCCLIWQVFGPWASPYGANGQISMTLHNYRSRQVHETLNGVNPYHTVVSEICILQSLDPICSKFDKFLANRQAHMGKWANDHNSAELQA